MATARARGIGSIDGLLDCIRAAREELGFKGGSNDGRECFCRGHPDDRWLLLSTLLRVAQDEKWDDEELWSVEADLYWEFNALAQSLPSGDLDSWGVLMQMREHWVATRLLDWTEILGVPLWFAMRTPPSGATGRCIWLMDPYELNRLSHRELDDLLATQFLLDSGEIISGYEPGDDDEWQTPLALYPVLRDQRLHAQRGYFTAHGTDRRPIDKQFPAIVRKVEIRKDEEPAVRHFLDVAGIDEHRLFPHPDSLGRFLHQKYGID